MIGVCDGHELYGRRRRPRQPFVGVPLRHHPSQGPLGHVRPGAGAEDVNPGLRGLCRRSQPRPYWVRRRRGRSPPTSGAPAAHALLPGAWYLNAAGSHWATATPLRPAGDTGRLAAGVRPKFPQQWGDPCQTTLSRHLVRGQRMFAYSVRMLCLSTHLLPSIPTSAHSCKYLLPGLTHFARTSGSPLYLCGDISQYLGLQRGLSIG